jgi:hypothetical protein
MRLSSPLPWHSMPSSPSSLRACFALEDWCVGSRGGHGIYISEGIRGLFITFNPWPQGATLPQMLDGPKLKRLGSLHVCNQQGRTVPPFSRYTSLQVGEPVRCKMRSIRISGPYFSKKKKNNPVNYCLLCSQKVVDGETLFRNNYPRKK